MLSLNDILFGVFLPGVVALAVFAVGWWRPRPASRAGGWWAAPISFAAAFCIGIAQFNGGIPSWPPAEAIHRIFFAAIVLMVVLVITGFPRIPALVRAVVAIVLAAVAFRYVLDFKWKTLPATEAWLWIGLCVAATALWWIGLVAHARRSLRVASPIALLILAGATSLLFMTSDTQTYGSMMLALVAAIAAAIVVALLSTSFTIGDAGYFLVSLITMLLVALSVNGHFAADAGIEPINAVLLFSSPIVLWLASLMPMRKMRPGMRAMLVILAMCVPLSVALVRATVKFQQTYKVKASSDAYEM
ncbi:MAG TPA: hypothetical protein VL282_13995 [Tepidisphaeraceae bacterium]|nr:hypothetical protein [Tepidisphaeraceae bacterium]